MPILAIISEKLSFLFGAPYLKIWHVTLVTNKIDEKSYKKRKKIDEVPTILLNGFRMIDISYISGANLIYLIDYFHRECGINFFNFCK